MENPVDHDYIARALKAEIISAKYGYDASYSYRLEGDDQVAKAIELFPEAEKLAVRAAEVHRTTPAPEGSRDSRAARSETPKSR
jgi:hypothetical protein